MSRKSLTETSTNTIPEFYVVNSFGEIYVGLYQGGYAKWSSDWEEGKPLNNINQLQTIKKMMKYEYGELDIKVELVYL